MGRGLRVLGFNHVSAFRDRHGKVRYRYRRKGCATTYLPGVPGSSEFAEAYAAAVAGVPRSAGEKRTKPGSINALIVAVYQSAEWEALAPTTRVTYRGIIERLRLECGDFPVTGMKTAHIYTMIDRRKATPAAANSLIRILRWLMEFAVRRQMRNDNPAAAIKPIRYKTDGFHTWTEPELAQFEARWPVGSRERLAFDLLLYTAQRSGDVRQMGRQHISDGFIEVTQEKTGAELDIPIHVRLASSLATVPSNQMQFLLTQHGESYTAKGFGNWMKAACQAAGLHHCSAHGLRKSAATRLADAGCTESQIQAITGHATSKEVQRYTRKRNQRLLAADALAKIGTESEQKLANLTTRLAISGDNRLILKE